MHTDTDETADYTEATTDAEPLPAAVTIGRRTLPTQPAPGGYLTAPVALSVITEIVMLAPRAPTRAAAAALGVCWRGPGSPKTKLAACGYDLGLYGGRVLDELVEREGGTAQAFAEVMTAGGVCLRMLLEQMPTEQEVAGLADFSQAHEAG